MSESATNAAYSHTCPRSPGWPAPRRGAAVVAHDDAGGDAALPPTCEAPAEGNVPKVMIVESVTSTGWSSIRGGAPSGVSDREADGDAHRRRSK